MLDVYDFPLRRVRWKGERLYEFIALMSIDCLRRLRENCGRYIRGLESPRSRNVSISWIAGRGKVSGLGRGVFYRKYDSAAASKSARHATRTFVQTHRIRRTRDWETDEQRERERERKRKGAGEEERDRWNDRGNGRGEEQDYKRRLYGRTLIRSLIEISISRVNAPRSDTSVCFVHNSS